MKLPPAQRAMLDKICRTNGGGVWAEGLSARTRNALERAGLIQGKSGRQDYAVHTREGLALWREQQAKQA